MRRAEIGGCPFTGLGSLSDSLGWVKPPGTAFVSRAFCRPRQGGAVWEEIKQGRWPAWSGVLPRSYHRAEASFNDRPAEEVD